MQKRVKLLEQTSLFNCVVAARECYDSMGNSDSSHQDNQFILGTKDEGLIRRIIQSQHESVIEHKVFTFHIQGFSRAVLQELARHRMASISVRSTRYTLKKMSKLSPEEFAEHLVQVDPDLDQLENAYISRLNEIVKQKGLNPDQFKHKMPESLKFKCVWTINARSLRNFLRLRLSKRAMWEIRELAQMIYDAIPSEQEKGILFGDIEW